MKDADFARANGILKHMVGLWLKEGNVSSQFPAIEPDDLRKMSEYFTRDSPENLQFEVWYSLVYHFGLRGREIISSVALSDVNISVDSDSRSFVSIKYNSLSKNIKQSLSEKEFENLKTSRMYDTPSNKDKCPVEAMRIYKTKIPSSNENLFPKPRNTWSPDGLWYTESRKVGKNQFGTFMSPVKLTKKMGRPGKN